MRVSAPIWSALLAVCAAAPLAAAPTAESLSAGAQAQLEQAFGRLQGLHFTAAPAANQDVTDQSLVHMYSPSATAGRPSTLVKELDLSSLLGRHLKTSLTYTLGGANVWVSGSFDRQQNAYVSILIDGQAAQYFNVKDLLTAPKILDIGTGKYRLSVSPDLTDQLQSEIVLTNAANRRDQQRITLQDMLTAVAAAGEQIDMGGQSYRFFYFDDVGASSQSFAFILTDAQGEFHVFLIPAEIVPSVHAATFKLYNSLPVGLLRSGANLRILQ